MSQCVGVWQNKRKLNELLSNYRINHWYVITQADNTETVITDTIKVANII